MSGTEPTPDPDDTTATGEPPAAGAGDPGTPSSGAAAPGQSGREPPSAQPEEPVGEEESVRQARRRGQESPHEILRKFFENSFNEEVLRTFCFDHFQQFELELKETDRFPDVVQRLIRYCESRGRIQELWDRVADEKKAQYDEWFPRWWAAERKYRNDRESKYGEFRDTASPRRPDSNQTPSEHPLSGGNPEAVSDWFFTDLGSADRGTVLATAIFQGMNRTYLVGVGQDFAKLFDPAADRAADDGSTRP